MKPGFAQCGHSDAMQEFLRGEALFIFAGTWDATGLKGLADFPVGAMRFPEPTRAAPHVGRYIRGALPDGMMATGMAFYLNRATPHPAEALDFLQFLTSYEAGEIFTAHSGWLSSVRGVRSSAEVETYRPFVDGYYTGASFMSVGPNTQMVFWRNFHHLLGHARSVSRFAAAMDAEMNDAVRADARADARNALATARRRDVELVAHRMLEQRNTDAAASDGDFCAAQTLSEVEAYQGLAALASPTRATSP
jgi:ABC-type glycerol-3-phosphate transport system substrate-binding protein